MKHVQESNLRGKYPWSDFHPHTSTHKIVINESIRRNYCRKTFAIAPEFCSEFGQKVGRLKRMECPTSSLLRSIKSSFREWAEREIKRCEWIIENYANRTWMSGLLWKKFYVVLSGTIVLYYLPLNMVLEVDILLKLRCSLTRSCFSRCHKSLE